MPNKHEMKPFCPGSQFSIDLEKDPKDHILYLKLILLSYLSHRLTAIAAIDRKRVAPNLIPCSSSSDEEKPNYNAT